MMDTDVSLRADCGRCAGLCCVALAFDRSALFAEDKAAGQPCRHLGSADRCTIHATRTSSGYAGCVAYDCLGAGQLVTQELFGGKSWRDCHDGGRAMFASFALARRVQEWRQLLEVAARLPLTSKLQEQRQSLVRRLRPPARMTPDTLAQLARGSVGADIARFLQALRQTAATSDLAVIPARPTVTGSNDRSRN
jgi:hypothetical protein